MKLPKKAVLVEVGPRDGFQNVKSVIPTPDKIDIIQKLIESGVKQMEITSFVNPRWVPQMADAKVVAKTILASAPADFRAIALTPNRRGVSDAIAAGLKNVTYVLSASESHNKSNVNKTIEESLAEVADILNEFGDQANFRISLSVVFGCPFEGDVPKDRVIRILKRLRELGIREYMLCDTVGVANPKQAGEVIEAVQDSLPDIDIGLHFHDTRGMGMANILTGLQHGITTYETSLGGLGGCPFAPGSAGNTSSEDMLNMWKEMGIESGIDLDIFMEAVEIVRERIDAPVTGRLANMCEKPFKTDDED